MFVSGVVVLAVVMARLDYIAVNIVLVIVIVRINCDIFCRLFAKKLQVFGVLANAFGRAMAANMFVQA